MISLETDSLTRTHWVAIGLAAVSGVIHLGIGVPGVPAPLAVSFVFAGLGFFGAIGLVLIG